MIREFPGLGAGETILGEHARCLETLLDDTVPATSMGLIAKNECYVTVNFLNLGLF